MRVLSSLMLLVACAVLSACALEGLPECWAEVSLVKRKDQNAAWTIAGINYQIYDFVVVNRGTCGVTTVIAFCSGVQGFYSEVWNYNGTTGVISGFGASLGAGQTFSGAGLVLGNASSIYSIGVAQMRSSCPDSCAATTAAPISTSAPISSTSAPVSSTHAPTSSTSAPVSSTSAPVSSTSTPISSTSAPITTSAPVQTTATPTQASSCAVTVEVKRDTYSWIDDQGRNTSIYHLTLTNAGPCAMLSFTLNFNFNGGYLVSHWNLQAYRGSYLVMGFGLPGYGNTVAAGSSYTAAGMILAGAPDNIIAYGSPACKC